ncbi:StbB family protein [Pseudomonas sp. Marseille-Q5115]|uniref:StbB family protein n=1 Tax=Pseudomonas sp. Marseille-Q5115 TaxID=2866593 RepID=UPI001CE4B09B|nr:StbB family protein [Pseudomonas sp. Marseille-Q5115]
MATPTKFLMVSYSGSVGKTVAALHLLYPRVPGAKFIALETINQSASDLGLAEVEKMQGKKVRELLEHLVLEDAAIVDVGASNIEQFFAEMTRFHGATDEFDLVVVPVCPDDKSWQEGLKTVESLLQIGVEADRIRILPNKIKEDPREEIPQVFEYAKKKKIPMNPDAFIFESEVYGYLAHHKMSFRDLIGDNRDYRAEAKAATDPAERSKLARLHSWTSQAKPVQANLDVAFDALVG